MGVHHNFATLFYHKIRLVTECHLALEVKELFDDEVELDGSYFGGRRKGKRGRGTNDKTIVFGILKHKDRLYTIIKDTKQNTLIPIIKSKVKSDSIVCTPIQATNQKSAC